MRVIIIIIFYLNIYSVHNLSIKQSRWNRLWLEETLANCLWDLYSLLHRRKRFEFLFESWCVRLWWSYWTEFHRYGSKN